MAIETNSNLEKGQLGRIDISINRVEVQELGNSQYEPQHSDDSQKHTRLDFNSAAHIIPWNYKVLALICVLSLPIGQTWTGASLGPLKNTLRNELGISNTQFGFISASDAIINSIWPIIGGVLLDWFGPNVIVLCCTGIILVGSILAGLTINFRLWRLLTGGHIAMGFGTAVLHPAMQKFFYHWFGAGGLALAFGLESAVARTVDLVVSW